MATDVPESFFRALSERRTTFQTHKALLVLGLQHDFLSPDGHFPVVNGDAILSGISRLVPAFRQHGYIYWIQTRNVAPLTTGSDHGPIQPASRSTIDDTDEYNQSTPDPGEHFLPLTNNGNLCHDPLGPGSSPVSAVESLQKGEDTYIFKQHYSAFHNTSLLDNLRSKIITELYLVGCVSNSCVNATALNAAEHGIQINLIQDCLGYRSVDHHSAAIRRLVRHLGATVLTCNQLMHQLNSPLAEDASQSPSPQSDPYSLPTPGTGEDHEVLGDRLLEPHKQGQLPLPVDSFMTMSNTYEANNAMHLQSLDNALDDDLGAGPFVAAEDITAKKRPSQDQDIILSDIFENSEPTKLSTHAMKAAPALSRKRPKHVPSLATLPLKLPGDTIGSGDSSVTYDFLPGMDCDDRFYAILNQVCWQKMSHASGEVPRLVCYQGDVDCRHGTMPVYRHPSDATIPLMCWSHAILDVLEAAQEVVGHPLNHAFIQLYRGGTDFISEHTDKTLDIVPNSKIANVSFGAQRTMRLRSKRARDEAGNITQERTTERIQLPHNSIFVMGPETNSHFLHGIMPDKRLPHDLSPAELDFDGLRISITFRHIATFVSHDSRLIWGQGAIAKTKEEARPVVNGPSNASEQLIKAFGIENQTTTLSWSEIYGPGSDVLNISGPSFSIDEPILFLCDNSIANRSVLLALNLFKVRASTYNIPILSPRQTTDDSLRARLSRQLTFRDNDTTHTETYGTKSVQLYLSHRYGSITPGQASLEITVLTAPLYEDFLNDTLSSLQDLDRTLTSQKRMAVRVPAQAAEEVFFLAGPEFGVADCAYLPLVQRAVEMGFDLPLLVDEWRGRVEGVVAGWDGSH